ncbi:S-adenosyl-L-methionine-dependent methyltransferase [Xylaria sp. FL1777]|nr:S-adenosyl-L-methionine-dependent methyltransferase [Xylaria sp. FL1777]
MGTGNRFKHQGIPEPLSEAHFAKLKRKAGLPVDDVPETKKRKAQNGKASGKANGKSNNSKAVQPVPSRNSKVAKPKSKKAKPEPELDLEDMSDGIGGGFSDEDMSDLDEDDELVDDFLGSDDSVYDSGGEQERRAMFSEDEDDSDGDAEEKLTAANIVGLSRKLDKERAEEEAAAEAEFQETLQTNIDIPHVLEDGTEEEQNKPLLAPDLQLLRQRISDTIRVLDDFTTLSETGTSRSEYTAQLLKDICAYYGYSEFLAEKLLNLFPPREALAFFDANETPRPIVIRTNTLKTSRRELASALINRGVTLEPVTTPEYLAGHYILQAASSFLPCMALQPQEGERILDMASAPGGKTTYLAALMKNTGCVFANVRKNPDSVDVSSSHHPGSFQGKITWFDRKLIVCNYDARDFPKVMGGFDRVLLGKPCTGTGVIAKDPSVKTNKTEKDFITIPHTQKQLLLGAIDSVNHAGTGGVIVYSTCSVSVEENEMVVQYALKKRPNVRLVSTELPFGKEGFTAYQGKTFDKSLSLTRRFYPHTLNLDGFFVAKFQKIGPTPAGLVKNGPEPAPRQEEVIDKTPILADDKVSAQAVGGDDFGGFDDEEDAEYMQRAKRNAMRKRGLDPKALQKPKAQNKAKSDSSEVKPKEKPVNGSKRKSKSKA